MSMVIQMTSSGRGRGWMSGSSGVLRRPGDPPEAPTSPVATVPPVATTPQPEVDAFMATIQTAPLHDPSALQSTLASSLTLLKEHFKTRSMLQTLVEKLHERSLEDRLFAQKAAAFCGVAHNVEVEGVKMRSLLLSAIQTEFAEKGSLQTANRNRFLNAVFFLCEVFHSVRLTNRPIEVLASPVLGFLEQLLNGEEQEIELFATAVVVNGTSLAMVNADGLQTLLLHVRTVLMTRNLSGQSRCWLQLTLDMANRDFKPLPTELHTFYQNHLGSVALSQLQRAPIPEPPVSPRAVAAQPDPASVPLPTSPVQQEAPKFPSAPTLAARRSSGGSDSQPQQRRNPRTPGSGRLPQSAYRTGDNSSASGSRGDWKDNGVKPKVWGHDDRFEKGEGFYSGEKGSGGGKSGGSWRSSGGDSGSQWNRRDKDRHEQQPLSSPTSPTFVIPTPQIPESEESWE